jgi:hypothetical protein
LYSKGDGVETVEVGDLGEGFAEVNHDNFLGNGKDPKTRIRVRPS